MNVSHNAEAQPVSPVRRESGVFGPRQMAEETAVYRIFDANNVLLYVGMSVSPETRFADHRTCKAWMRQAYRYEIAWFGIREAAEAEERRAIAQERPLHNVAHKPRSARPVVLSTPGTYTMAEMAERFGVSKTTVRATVRSAGFPAPIGAAPSGRRGTRFPMAEVDQYWERRQAGIKQGKRTDLAPTDDQGEEVTKQQAVSVPKTVTISTPMSDSRARALAALVYREGGRLEISLDELLSAPDELIVSSTEGGGIVLRDPAAHEWDGQ